MANLPLVQAQDRYVERVLSSFLLAPEVEGQPPVLRQMNLERDLYWYSPGAVREMQAELLSLLADIKRFDVQNYSLDLPQDIRARIERALNGEL